MSRILIDFSFDKLVKCRIVKGFRPLIDQEHTYVTALNGERHRRTVHRPTAWVRRLYAQFGGKHWRQLDGNRGNPVEFVEAMTAPGFLGALIPEGFVWGEAWS